ncbi:MAG: biotin--[acetyl-CoA-carboxylase] ligase [Eubacterium sp.]|nr:biotin--[acetyl-CoA-carboxylase] ligase [Eubacterium sp.]
MIKLDKAKIQQGIKNNAGVIVLDEIDSTNVELIRMAREGVKPGSFLLAESQTKGKGRMGREFFSPYGTGLYMSFLVKAPEDTMDILSITTATSVAVSRAIDECVGVSTQIKWVNDIYYKSRKVCGILAEAVVVENDIDSIVVGIGINTSTEYFPSELEGYAGALGVTEIDRNQLAVSVYNNFFDILDKFPARDYMDEYREKSLVIGKNVRFLEDDKWKDGFVIDVDDIGGLVLQVDDGGVRRRRVIRTGEVSVRIKE